MTAQTPVQRAHARVAELTEAWTRDANTVERGPRPAYCACSAPWWEHAGKSWAGGCVRTGCRRYRQDVADMLVERAMDAYGADPIRAVQQHEADERAKARAGRAPREAGQWGVSVSDLSRCRRAIQYREAPPEGLFTSPTTKRQATIGTAIHAAIEKAMTAMYEWREFEQPVEIPGLDTRGRIDMHDPITGVVSDFKSAGDWKWDVVGAEGVLPYEREQVLVYMLALREIGEAADKGEVIYVNRENGKVESFEFDYDEAAAVKALEYLLGVTEALDRGEELPKDRLGPSVDPICRMCEFREFCWDMPRAKELGRSPESLDAIGDPADIAAAEMVLTQYAEARDDEGAAKKEKALAKTRLEGLAPGVYGGMILGFRGQARDDNARWAREVVEQWNDPNRGDAPPVMHKYRSESIDVRAIRAARAGKPRKGADVPTATEAGAA